MKTYQHPAIGDISLSLVMQALSDPYRVDIVRTILAAEGRELACNEIPLPLSKATVSHHFDTLRASGLIRTRVEGTKCLSCVREDEIEARFPGLLALVLAEAAAK